MYGIIKIYTRTWSQPCFELKTFLIELGIDFEEIDLDENPKASSYIKHLNKEGFGEQSR